MTMPLEIVFARHGQSEANIVQKNLVDNIDEMVAGQIYDRPDWQNRLTSVGVEQARIVHKYVEKYLGGIESFGAQYVSPFIRTRETAAYLGGLDKGAWMIDERLIERSWGIFGKISREAQSVKFPMTANEKSINPWYVRLEGGESMHDVYVRFRDFLSTLHREHENDKVFVVTHGEFIKAAIFGIDRMLPEEWEQMDRDRKFDILNCMMIHWSRVNPEDPNDVRSKLSWRRYINPENPKSAPFEGRWVEMGERRHYNGRELVEQVNETPRLYNEGNKNID